MNKKVMVLTILTPFLVVLFFGQYEVEAAGPHKPTKCPTTNRFNTVKFSLKPGALKGTHTANWSQKTSPISAKVKKFVKATLSGGKLFCYYTAKITNGGNVNFGILFKGNACMPGTGFSGTVCTASNCVANCIR